MTLSNTMAAGDESGTTELSPRDSQIDRSDTRIAMSETSNRPATKGCPICHKELHWYSRKRECTLCRRVVCRECASKKVVPGEMVCLMCKSGEGLPDEGTGNATYRSGSTLMFNPLDGSSDVSWKAGVAEGFYANLNVKIFEGRGLIASDTNLFGQLTSSDPYCVVSFTRDNTRRITKVRSNTLNPIWNQGYDIPIQFPSQFMVIEVYDKDLTNKDDFLGEVRIPIDRLANGREISGWVPLVLMKDMEESPGEGTEAAGTAPPPGFVTQVPIPAGAIRIAVRLDYYVSRELHAYVRSAIATPPPQRVKFDLNALYGPAMLLQDVLWISLLEPIVQALVFVLTWQNFFVSTFAVLVWIPIGFSVAYWPAGLCFSLDVLIVTNYVRGKYNSLAQPLENLDSGKPKRRYTIKKLGNTVMDGVTGVGGTVLRATQIQRIAGAMGMTSGSGGTASSSGEKNGDKKEYEEQNLNGLVTKAALLSPGWVKELAAGYQPLLRSVVDGVILVFDIFGGKHRLSIVAFFVFLVSGVILLFLPFRYLFTAIGISILTAMSPLMVLGYGVGFYFLKPPPFKDIADFGMSKDFDDTFMSNTAAAENDKRNKRSSNN
jgi:hypothetical protein